MANTIMTAKNTFGEGLIMDFAPDNTQANCLTNALNATLLTFNGNEMSLLNDMGNGRVETARLPDGYVPVGTCEFGDIIYIVSYNPILNKSQIGCFPSPERNISSTELGNTGTVILALDFQVMNGSRPTGELISNTKKYILYEKALNPGDKYIIYNDSLGDSIEANVNTLTDMHNESHVFESLPRFITLHVVSVEESGKITYLDSTVKWYDKNDLHYFILNCLSSNYQGVTGKIDLDSYRSLVSSAYSIFQSKVSGKLAILAELEKINGFDCTYGVYSKGTKMEGNTELKDYSIFFECNWTSEDPNINPYHLVLTASDWKKQNVPLYDKDGEVISTYTKVANAPVSRPTNNIGNYWHTDITNYGDYWKSSSYASYHSNCYTTKLESYQSEHKNIVRVLNNVDDNTGVPKEGEYLPITDKGIKCKTNKSGANYYYYNDDKGNEIQITPVTNLPDTLINNYFHYGVMKHFWDVTIPGLYINPATDKKPKEIYQYYKKDLIYHYLITPAMPYGLLSEYAIDGYIDFSKIGSGIIDLLKWKYYNTANTVTLTFGLDVYPEPNKGVSEVVLEFYDNQGFAAAYHISGRKSYSGTFTEIIPLNGSTASYKLNAIKANGKDGETHIGLPVSEDDVEASPDTYIKVEDNNVNGIPAGWYTNDCGTLYSGIVYFVKIIVKYDEVNALGEFKEDPNADYSESTYYRWLWTNLMFNERYYDTDDYNLLPVNLTLDVNPSYSSAYDYKAVDYSSPLATEDRLNNLGATIQYINGKIKMKVTPGLQNTYNSFLLNKNEIKSIPITLYDGDLYIENSPEKVEVLHTGDRHSTDLEEIQPIVPKDLPLSSEDSDKYFDLSKLGPACTRRLETEIQGTGLELYEREIDAYLNTAKISLANILGQESTSELEYACYNGQTSKPVKGLNYSSVASSADTESFADINIELLHFSKYYKEFGTLLLDVTALYPIIYTPEDLEKYGLLFIESVPLSSEGHRVGHVYVNYLIPYYAYRDVSSHMYGNYGYHFIDNSGNFSLSDLSVKKRFDSNTWGYQTMYNGLVTSDKGQSVTDNGVDRFPSIMDIMKDKTPDIESTLHNKFVLFAPVVRQLGEDKWELVTSDLDPHSRTSILNSYLYYYGTNTGATSDLYITSKTAERITNKLLRVADAVATLPTYGMTFLGYTGNENNNLHLFNSAFILQLDRLTIKQSTTLPFTIKDVPSKYWVNDGYDYYYFAIYWYSNNYSTGVGGALNGFSYKLLKFTTDAEYKNAVIKPTTGLSVRNSLVYRCKSEDTPNIQILATDFWNNKKILTTITLTDSITGSYSSGNNYISPATININAQSKNGTMMYISEASSSFKLEDSLFYTKEELFLTYAGDMIISALLSLYAIRGDEQIPSLDVIDLAFLKPNTTLYTKEIICLSKLPEINDTTPNHNNLIIINGSMHYGKYLDELKTHLPKDDSKISYSNVNVIINDCLKTCPLQLALEYKSPSMTLVGNVANAVVHTASGETVLTVINNLDNSMLYELNSENKLSKLSAGHTFTYAENFEIVDKGDGEVLQAHLSKYASKSNKYLKSTIGYDSDLLILKDKFDRTLVRSKYFGINNERHNGGRDSEAGYYDNNKQEILLPEIQVIQV